MSTHTAYATTSLGKTSLIHVPTPSKPGPDQVIIKIAYTGLVPFDTYFVDLGFKLTEESYPLTLGIAASGEVVSLGEGVEGLGVGDRVTAFTYAIKPPFKLEPGGLQRYCLVQRSLVAKIPPTLSLPQAATLPDNLITAYWSIFGPPNLSITPPPTFPSSTPKPPSESVLIWGAGSSAGQYFLQLFKLAGFTKIITTSSPRNFERLRKLGASDTLSYASESIVEDIRSALVGEGEGKAVVKYVIDIIAVDSSLSTISKVTGGTGESRIAVLMPFKVGTDKVRGGPESEMSNDPSESVKGMFEGKDLRRVFTFLHQQDENIRNTLMQKIVPDLLQKGLIQPNEVRLMKEGSLSERVEKGLELLRGNKVSGEKVVVEFVDE